MQWEKPDIILSDWWLVGKDVIKYRKGGIIPAALSRQGAWWDQTEWFKKIIIDYGGESSALAC